MPTRRSTPEARVARLRDGSPEWRSRRRCGAEMLAGGIRERPATACVDPLGDLLRVDGRDREHFRARAGDREERRGRAFATADAGRPQPGDLAVERRRPFRAQPFLEFRADVLAPAARQARSSQTWATIGGRGVVENMGRRRRRRTRPAAGSVRRRQAYSSAGWLIHPKRCWIAWRTGSRRWRRTRASWPPRATRAPGGIARAEAAVPPSGWRADDGVDGRPLLGGRARGQRHEVHRGSLASGRSHQKGVLPPGAVPAARVPFLLLLPYGSAGVASTRRSFRTNPYASGHSKVDRVPAEHDGCVGELGDTREVGA